LANVLRYVFGGLAQVLQSCLRYEDTDRQGASTAFLKRALDITGALVLLTMAMPLMLVTAVAVFVDGQGPVLDRQKRIGLRGRVFTRLRFRTLRLNAERDGAAHGTRKCGARRTSVGAFIHRSRIDELPHLFSVLVGDMSLVGPRPETPGVAARLRKEIPFYDARHAVKPGLTGYAQVHGGARASFDARPRHELDVHYVNSNSLGLDWLVLVETVRVTLSRNGR